VLVDGVSEAGDAVPELVRFLCTDLVRECGVRLVITARPDFGLGAADPRPWEGERTTAALAGFMHKPGAVHKQPPPPPPPAGFMLLQTRPLSAAEVDATARARLRSAPVAACVCEARGQADAHTQRRRMRGTPRSLPWPAGSGRALYCGCRAAACSNKGQRVEGDFGGRNQWQPARVRRCHADGSADLEYDSGEREERVRPQFWRRGGAAAPAATAEVATAGSTVAAAAPPPSGSGQGYSNAAGFAGGSGAGGTAADVFLRELREACAMGAPALASLGTAPLLLTMLLDVAAGRGGRMLQTQARGGRAELYAAVARTVLERCRRQAVLSWQWKQHALSVAGAGTGLPQLRQSQAHLAGTSPPKASPHDLWGASDLAVEASAAVGGAAAAAAHTPHPGRRVELAASPPREQMEFWAAAGASLGIGLGGGSGSDLPGAAAGDRQSLRQWVLLMASVAFAAHAHGAGTVAFGAAIVRKALADPSNEPEAAADGMPPRPPNAEADADAEEQTRGLPRAQLWASVRAAARAGSGGAPAGVGDSAAGSSLLDDSARAGALAMPLLLWVPAAGEARYRFCHVSMQEFFCALEVLRRISAAVNAAAVATAAGTGAAANPASSAAGKPQRAGPGGHRLPTVRSGSSEPEAEGPGAAVRRLICPVDARELLATPRGRWWFGTLDFACDLAFDGAPNHRTLPMGGAGGGRGGRRRRPGGGHGNADADAEEGWSDEDEGEDGECSGRDGDSESSSRARRRPSSVGERAAAEAYATAIIAAESTRRQERQERAEQAAPAGRKRPLSPLAAGRKRAEDGASDGDGGGADDASTDAGSMRGALEVLVNSVLPTVPMEPGVLDEDDDDPGLHEGWFLDLSDGAQPQPAADRGLGPETHSPPADEPGGDGTAAAAAAAAAATAPEAIRLRLKRGSLSMLFRMLQYHPALSALSLAGALRPRDAEACRLIRDGLAAVRSLSSLDVSRNPLSRRGARFLAQLLGRARSIKQLTLGEEPDTVITIHHRARALRLGGMRLGVSALLVAAFVPRCGRLLDVELRDDDLRAQGASAMGSSLQCNLTVGRVDLSNMHGCTTGDITSAGLSRLAQGLLANKASALHTVDLSGNRLGQGPWDKERSCYAHDMGGVSRLADALADSTHCALRSVELAGNPIGDKGAAILARGLQSNASLVYLGLRGCAVLARGHRCLGQAMLGAPDCRMCFARCDAWQVAGAKVTELRLRGAGLGPSGGLLLAGALKHNGGITAIDLLQNGLGVRSAEALAEALGLGGHLGLLRTLCGIPEGAQAVDLSDMHLDDGDCVLVASDLRHLPALTALDLSHNYVHDAGAAHLSKALLVAPSLVALTLERVCWIDPDIREDMMNTCTLLRDIKLSVSCI
jgi:Ran GTPase-activating protein (RanGAP) involved in mRNA processing and transport